MTAPAGCGVNDCGTIPAPKALRAADTAHVSGPSGWVVLGFDCGCLTRWAHRLPNQEAPAAPQAVQGRLL